MLHNWFLGYGIDEVVPPEASWVPNNNAPHGHAVPSDDHSGWASITDEIANQMWANRGHTHI